MNGGGLDEVHAEEDQGLRSQDIVGVSFMTIPLLKACEYHYPSSVPLAVIKYHRGEGKVYLVYRLKSIKKSRPKPGRRN